jgi:hypothetical protein
MLAPAFYCRYTRTWLAGCFIPTERVHVINHHGLHWVTVKADPVDRPNYSNQCLLPSIASPSLGHEEKHLYSAIRIARRG